MSIPKGPEKLKSVLMPKPVILQNAHGRGRPEELIVASDALELIREGPVVTVKSQDGTEYRLAGWLVATPMRETSAK